MAKGESPAAGDARGQLDLVSALTGVDAEILSQLVALVFHAKFHLFRIARSNPHAAVIGVHAHVGAPSHGKRLGDFFGAGRDRRSSQKGRAGNSQPNSGRAVGQRVHIKDPPKGGVLLQDTIVRVEMFPAGQSRLVADQGR